MRLSLTIFLLLSSFFLLLPSCKISKYKKVRYSEKTITRNDILPVLKDDQAIKFRTTIDIIKNHLSGILIVKQTDSVTKHMVFVTELGMKMFDFEIVKSDIKANYVFEPLNKPVLISALQENFKNMLLLDVFDRVGAASMNRTPTTIFRLTDESAKRFFKTGPSADISLQEAFHKNRRSAKYVYEYDRDAKAYHKITGKQYGIVKFYFELNYIPKTNE